MKSDNWIRRSLLAAACVLLASGSRAEGVHLSVGRENDTVGQGWLFRTATGFCGVVTAAHVVAKDGRIQNVLIHSVEKGEGVGADVRILSPTDAARLSLRATRATDTISEGLSGSVVIARAEDGRSASLRPKPLAMNYIYSGEVGDGGFDRVKSAVNRALALGDIPPASAAVRGALNARVASWRGETLDTACTAENVLTPKTPCGWKVRAAAGERSVSLVLDLSWPVFAGVELSVLGVSVPNARASLEAATRASLETWVWLRSAPFTAGAVTAAIAPVEAQRVRITLPVAKRDVAEIRVVANPLIGEAVLGRGQKASKPPSKVIDGQVILPSS